MEVVVIVPSFSHFGYAKTTVETALAHTPGCKVALVDDASPDWKKQDWKKWPLAGMHLHRFARNGGLTRSWNYGLRLARDWGAPYAVCANSDLLFTPGWFEALKASLAAGCHLAGPVTNAPGHNPLQQVARYLPDYKLTDDPRYLAKAAARLGRLFQPGHFVKARLNGYCMAARTDVWWSGTHDKDSVFDPKHKMVLNEDELQGRWKKLGRLAGAVPASFVFHYRGVSRRHGHRGKEGRGWFRKSKGT
jgi:GT2 family glycosyltransferase